jgi:cell wall-associated NlpC family hydrolase
MPVERSAIIREARRLVGTKYVHQGRLAGVACDCIGLPVLVARALGYLDAIPPADYARRPDGSRLQQALIDHLDHHDGPPLPGDVVLMTWRRMPMHVAIAGDGAEPFSLIHAYAGAGKVVEHVADAAWRSRILAAYSFRGVV